MTSAAGAPARFELVIEPGRSARNYWRDIWRYRELMYFLAWRDIVVRYKQTAIGVVWALMRPALTMVVFVGFRRLAGLTPGAIPEPILVFAAVLPWQFFSTALSDSSGSLIGNANLISKIYFPRLIVPLSSVAVALIEPLPRPEMRLVSNMSWNSGAKSTPATCSSKLTRGRRPEASRLMSP